MSRQRDISGGRPITEEEAALWRQTTRSITPRIGRRVDQPASESPGGKGEEREPTKTSPVPAIRPFVSQRRPGAIEASLRRRLARGKIQPDDILDLHGLTQREAYFALEQFLHRNQGERSRVVLVITGKGSPTGEGVLRRNVPHWLNSPKLRDFIVGFEEALPLHGGAGSLYVRIRKRQTAP